MALGTWEGLCQPWAHLREVAVCRQLLQHPQVLHAPSCLLVEKPLPVHGPGREWGDRHQASWEDTCPGHLVSSVHLKPHSRAPLYSWLGSHSPLPLVHRLRCRAPGAHWLVSVCSLLHALPAESTAYPRPEASTTPDWLRHSESLDETPKVHRGRASPGVPSAQNTCGPDNTGSPNLCPSKLLPPAEGCSCTNDPCCHHFTCN